MADRFTIERTHEFVRDFKTLEKRYKTLQEDFQTFVKAQLSIFHLHGIDNGGIVPISGLGDTQLPIFKAKKFTSRSMKGKGVRTGIRIIYSYDQRSRRLTFIEIYMKQDKETEDRERIKKYLQSL